MRQEDLRLSNLTKAFWPDEGITKGDLIDYYRAVAPVLVPHLRNRPFTMKRYPDGWQAPFFFQKDASSHVPPGLRTASVEVRRRDGTARVIEAPIVDDEASLLWMVNSGCIDMNAWCSRVDRLDRPDHIVFDLDPSDGLGSAEAAEIALEVRRVLDGVGLASFPKTSGSKGMHVLVPIARRYGFERVREFAALVARAVATGRPGLATREWSKAKRRGVLIDVNQNGRGRTTASVYSVRPRPGAPVSTPLRWDEVTAALDPAAFTMDAVVERVRRHGDLQAPLLATPQRLEQAFRTLGASDRL